MAERRYGKNELPGESDKRRELLAILQDLREEVYATYPINTVQSSPEDPLASSEARPERWWEVQERPFVSTVPLFGPFIAWFRTAWNSVSTKWFVRTIRQQQNHINSILVQDLERQAQILELQGQILRELDQDQTRLLTRFAEIAYRLDLLEAQIDGLQKHRD